MCGPCSVCPIPTYLIGVDEKAEVAYIVSIHGKLTGGISSIPTAYPARSRQLRILRDEVRAYWRTLAARQKRRRPHSFSKAQPMAQKTTQQQRFIAERVRALAVVYLTRREDLIVTEETADIGVDLWVTLNLEDKEGHRKFGVELQGRLDGGDCRSRQQGPLPQHATNVAVRTLPVPRRALLLHDGEERRLVHLGRGAGRFLRR